MAARLLVRVQPGGRRNAFSGWFGDLPKVTVSAPPVEGAANEAVVAVVAAALGLRARAVRLISGHTSRTKVLEIDGLDGAEVERLVLGANPKPGG